MRFTSIDQISFPIDYGIHFLIAKSGHSISFLLNVKMQSNQARQIRSITIWGINYAPEKTGIGPQTTWLAKALLEQGYRVTVVCAFSYYPAWMKNPKDRGRLYRSEQIDGVAVRRNWLYVPKAPSLIRRTLQQLSFVTLSALRILFSPAADLYLVVSPPFLLSPVMRLLAFLKSRPYVVHLQDDEVQAAYETTNMGIRVYRTLKALEIWGYRGATYLSTISEGMRSLMQRHLNRASSVKHEPEIALLANRVSGQAENPNDTVTVFRKTLNTRRLLVYSGNLGDKQVLDAFIPAVATFPKEELTLYICGQGAQKPRLQELIDKVAADNIRFESLLPDDEYRTLLAAADACVLSEMTHKGRWLSPGICFASKMLSYMKQGKPLFLYAGMDSEAAGIIRDENCGFALAEEQKLEKLLSEFTHASDETLEAMGKRSRQCYHQFIETYGISPWCDEVLRQR